MILSRNLWAVVGLAGLVRGAVQVNTPQINPTYTNSTSTPTPVVVLEAAAITVGLGNGAAQNYDCCQSCSPTTVTVTCTESCKVSTTTCIVTVQ
jgi:hypothetical protein